MATVSTETAISEPASHLCSGPLTVLKGPPETGSNLHLGAL